MGRLLGSINVLGALVGSLGWRQLFLTGDIPSIPLALFFAFFDEGCVAETAVLEVDVAVLRVEVSGSIPVSIKFRLWCEPSLGKVTGTVVLTAEVSGTLKGPVSVTSRGICIRSHIENLATTRLERGKTISWVWGHEP